MRKYIAFTCFMFLTMVLLRAQDTTNVLNKVAAQPIKVFKAKPYLHYGSVFIAGCFDRFTETLQHHYPKFKERFPNANDSWFNPSISWTNKYHFNDPDRGEKFPGSSSVFVAGTDAYHLSRTLNKTFMICTVFTFSKPEKWYGYIIKAAAMSIAYAAGKQFIYNVVFR